MSRDKLDFKDFEENYINRPDGYLSVWFSFINPKEDSDYEEFHELGEEVKANRLILQMDMVYPPRLGDGKIVFLCVEINTQEEYEKAVSYLRKTQNLLKESLDENFKSSEEEVQEIEFL